MSSTTDFIAELVRAANEAVKLRRHKRRDLLVRAVSIIRHMAATVDRPVAQAAAEGIVDLQVQVAIIGARADTPEEVREALLLTASMIRELHIILDNRAETETAGKNVE